MKKNKFTETLKKLFAGRSEIDSMFFEDLTDSLIEGDVGVKTACEIASILEKNCRDRKISDEAAIFAELRSIIAGWIKSASYMPEKYSVSVYLLLGVNGVGKTTTAAKMARWYKEKTRLPVVLAAADTFRAAAIEQLQFHGEKTGTRVVAHRHGADPGAVVFDAAEAVEAAGEGLVIADTAGRLHNRENLVRELQKIDRIASQKASPGCYKKLLVLDATTGQNGFRQAEVFNDAVGVDGIVLTKYDSTAKGGIVVSIGKELGLPVVFVGTGETYADFAPFSVQGWFDDFFGKTSQPV